MLSTAEKEYSRKFDQFYTNPDIAEVIVNISSNILKFNEYTLFLEPSAGTGNILNYLPTDKRVGIDIDPKHSEVIKCDFFSYECYQDNVLVIGNPPFGKNSSLAIRFFNHAAKFANTIAFILPRTFRKKSLQDKLDTNFILLYDRELPNNSFIFNDEQYDVPSCFQIWIKTNIKREKAKTYTFKDVEKWFKKVSVDDADFAFQRVGVKAGSVKTGDLRSFSPSSHIFIKQKFYWVLDVFRGLDFDSVKYETAGNPSISNHEMIELWIKRASELGLN